MIKNEFSQCISINKIDETGYTDKITNWFPLSNSKEKQKIEQVKKWLKKNFKKTESVNKILNSNLLYSIYSKDYQTINVSKGIFIYSLFQENYIFFNKSFDNDNRGSIYFNITWKDKKLNKIVEMYQ